MQHLCARGALRTLCFSLTAFCLCAASGLAQRDTKKRNYRKFEVNDEVAVFFLGDVTDGVVTAVDKTRVQVEFPFAGTMKREIYPYDQVRYRWEKDTISDIRKWSAENGHEVIASLLEVDGQNIVLRKLDGGDVTVPIAMLSTRDQRFLDEFRESSGPLMARPMDPVEFDTTLNYLQATSNSQDNLASVSPDVASSDPQFVMAGASFQTSNMSEMACLAPIGGGDAWLAAGTVDWFGNPSQIIWSPLAQKKVAKMQLLPAGEALLAVHAASRQILTTNTGEGVRNRTAQDQVLLTVWQSDPSMDTAKAKVSWKSNPVELDEDRRERSGNTFAASNAEFVHWGKFIDARTVIHQTQTQEYVVWDIQDKRERYRLQQEAFFGLRPQLSPNNKYLLFPEDDRLRILDAPSGQTLATLTAGDEQFLGAGIDPRGERLAALTRGRVLVWTFGADSSPTEFKLESTRSGFGESVEWVDSSKLMFGGKTLFDLELGQAIWHYVAQPFEVKEGKNFTQLQTIYGGKLVYAVEKDGMGNSFIVVGAVDLPGPKVMDTVASIDREAMYLIHPGSRVRIEADCGSYSSTVTNNLTELANKNGWQVDNAAPNVLKAWMGRLPKTTQTYHIQKGRGASETKTVTIEPFASRLRILVGGQEVWKNSTRSFAPSSVFLLPGQSIEGRVQAMQRPIPEFFARVSVPEKIIDPKFKNGFGTSTLSSAGLTAYPHDGSGGKLPTWARAR